MARTNSESGLVLDFRQVGQISHPTPGLSGIYSRDVTETGLVAAPESLPTLCDDTLDTDEKNSV